jgi:hypothetical protein
MAQNREKISDVFKTIGQPTVTYVKRDNGKLEKQLNAALNERGQLCLLTGPSKTGKTTLYREVLASRTELALVVQCDRTKSCDTIWKQALEAVDFERTETRSTSQTLKWAVEGEGSSKLGWKWLADVTARLKGTLAKDSSETEARRRVLADPGPDLLIPLLKHTNYVLVIEDFHYLEEDQKQLLFQQWKRFVDNEISVLVLGTTHRAVDIANSNRDLVGRIAQIDVAHWEPKDLEKICDLGFNYLNTNCTTTLKNLVANEAVGLPIVVQQVCQQFFTNEDIQYVDEARKSHCVVTRDKIENSLHTSARLKYTQFESYYSTLIRGPREKARKYRTYELVLACFTLDPIKFSLGRAEIDQRMAKLGLDRSEYPPPASLNSTLGALKKFQEKRDFQLFEWRPNEEVLYIIEPAFLFYVRWRTKKETQPMQLDLFELLIRTTWHDNKNIKPDLSVWRKALAVRLSETRSDIGNTKDPT